MKERRILIYLLGIAFIIFTPIVSYAQFGNTLTGFVFGSQRQPVSDATVELLDDYSRSVGRTRTNASGRYMFNRISSGRFRVRVLSLGLNYEEQEQEFEIQNFASQNSQGSIVTSGYENVQKDFYLRPRKGSEAINKSESIFVQVIPEQAKQTYKKALEELDSKNDEQGLKDLKSAIEAFPDYYDALERLGTEYIKSQHYVPAQILLQKAVQINPRGYKSWYGLAYSLYSLNNVTDAIEAAQKATSLNQFSVESPLLTGLLLRISGKFDQAEKQLKKAKELSKGTVPEVYWQLALLYGNNLKRYEEAADELEIFLKIRPNAKNAENIKKLVKEFREKAKSS